MKNSKTELTNHWSLGHNSILILKLFLKTHVILNETEWNEESSLIRFFIRQNDSTENFYTSPSKKFLRYASLLFSSRPELRYFFQD